MFYGKLKIAAGVMMATTAVGVGTVATGYYDPQPTSQAKKAGPDDAPAPKPAFDQPVEPVLIAGPSADDARHMLRTEHSAAQNRDAVEKMQQQLQLETDRAEANLANLRAELQQFKKRGLTRAIEETAPPPMVPQLRTPTVMADPPPWVAMQFDPPQSRGASMLPESRPRATELPRPVPTAEMRLPVPMPTPAKSFTVTGPRGEWHRMSTNQTTTLKFTDDRLVITCEARLPDGPKMLTVEADYSFNRDGVVFGYVTGVDGPDDVEELQSQVDRPFSFRFRADETSVTIKDFKVWTPGLNDGKPTTGQLYNIITNGRYTDKRQPTATLPTPRAMEYPTPRRTAPPVYETRPATIPPAYDQPIPNQPRSFPTDPGQPMLPRSSLPVPNAMPERATPAEIPTPDAPAAPAKGKDPLAPKPKTPKPKPPAASKVPTESSRYLDPPALGR